MWIKDLIAATKKTPELKRACLKVARDYFGSWQTARRFVRFCKPLRDQIAPLRAEKFFENPEFEPSKARSMGEIEDLLLDGEVALDALKKDRPWQNITSKDLGPRGREHVKRSLRRILNELLYEPNLRSGNKQHIDLVKDVTILLLRETERISGEGLRYAEDNSLGLELITAALEFIFQPPLLPILGHSSIVKLIPVARSRGPFQLELWHGRKGFWGSNDVPEGFVYECPSGHVFRLSPEDADSWCPDCGSEFLKRVPD